MGEFACGSSASLDFQRLRVGKYLRSSALYSSRVRVLLACSDDSSGSGSDSSQKMGVRIKVFETSDIHGYIIDVTGGKEDAFQYRLAYLAKIFDKARVSGEYDDVLLLDGGDIYQGAPVSNLTKGAVMRAAMDVMDYDAVSLGNHEFDWDV